jgi:uncharacterized transporter YbjL
MPLFQLVIGLLLGAAVLTTVARRSGVPYPVLLALGGVALAFVPFDAASARLDPDLALALFVAPVLLDAAYDTSLRDLRANWRPISSLVIVAVGLTVAAVACVAHVLVPDMPWAGAITLGAIVAPPDAVAATSVLRQLSPPIGCLSFSRARACSMMRRRCCFIARPFMRSPESSTPGRSSLCFFWARWAESHWAMPWPGSSSCSVDGWPMAPSASSCSS